MFTKDTVRRCKSGKAGGRFLVSGLESVSGNRYQVPGAGHQKLVEFKLTYLGRQGLLPFRTLENSEFFEGSE